MELTTVADDEVVIFDGPDVRRYEGLAPGVEHTLDGVTVRTLDRPAGERLATIATVNDVHFGEVVCGVLDDDVDIGPTFTSAPGEEPYPVLMNRAAVAEIAALAPDAVVAKGDLTNLGVREEYDAFLVCYDAAFGDTLVHIRGNHDAYRGETFAAFGPQVVDVPGARLAVLDSTIPGSDTGQLDEEQRAWLADVAADAARERVPVLCFTHHHPWSPDSAKRSERYFGVNPDDSESLVQLVAEQPAIIAWFSGHTHRNRVRRFRATGSVPWVEVACVKDFPGAWAEYRVHEGGVLQVFHRIADPAAIAWTDKTRGMYGGLYTDYAFGALSDRCFEIPLRW